MILISLMLAAMPGAPAAARVEPRRETAIPRRASAPKRSQRLIQLEAAVRSLPLTAAEPIDRAGPQGM